MFKIIHSNGIFNITDGSTTFGPYNSYTDMTEDIQDNEIEIMYEPKDLIFDLWIESNKPVMIYLSDKPDAVGDNLGYHNVTGLPYGLVAEDMECVWAAPIGLTDIQIIQDMQNAGFTYQKFL